VRAFVQRHDRVYVVEQNRDGQMADLLRLEVAELSPRIRKVLHYNGIPIDAQTITEDIVAAEHAAKEEK
jgi:2-oxoglutarate ferredoxin oxidoreductase subunit alpha